RWSALMWPSCRMKTLTMTSRLPDRRPPAGRSFSTNSVADGTATGLRRERRSAAAGGFRVGVLDGEAAAHVVIDEVDFGVLEIPQADGVDEQAHAVDHEYLVGFPVALALVDHQAILEAAAAAALDEHPEARILFVLF